jgi:hypothetical protein
MRRPGFTRAEFEARAGGNLSADRWYKPEVRILEHGGVRYCVKDFRRRPWFWRETAGRIVIAREALIHRSLDGLPGIPRFFGQLDGLSLVTEYIEGTDVSSFKKGRLPDGLLDRLGELVATMHERGIVHCDLRQRKNVIVGPGDRPWIIDFASGVRLPPRSFLLRLLAWIDESGIAKLRQKHDPDSLSDRERELLKADWFRPIRRVRRARRAMRKAERKAARLAERGRRKGKA